MRKNAEHLGASPVRKYVNAFFNEECRARLADAEKRTASGRVELSGKNSSRGVESVVSFEVSAEGETALHCHTQA